MPARSSAGDPTIGGGTLVVYNTNGSGESVTVTLPSSGWSAYDSASTPKGYRYKGADSSAAITRVTVKGDLIKVRGGKANWAYTLNEPSQGKVAVRLRLGSSATWCADVPAKPGASNDAVDKFTGLPKAPAPLACPALP